jgi:hypothetical protein
MSNSLLSVVPETLQHGLTTAETLVLDAATEGTYAEFLGREESKTAIRAELLYWLCVSREAANMLHAKGVCISGATIQGNLDFETATLQYPLRLHQCSISDGAVFDRAVARVLDFSGSTIASFSAPGLLAGC